VLKDVEVRGQEALELKTPFDEVEIIDTNKDFIFENIPGLKNVHVLTVDSPTEVPNSQ
jgi:hypothetical protein